MGISRLIDAISKVVFKTRIRVALSSLGFIGFVVVPVAAVLLLQGEASQTAQDEPSQQAAQEEKASAAALTPQSYTVTDLGTLGGSWSTVSDVNEHEQAVGHSRTGEYYTDAFLYEDGARDLVGNGLARNYSWTFKTGRR